MTSHTTIKWEAWIQGFISIGQRWLGIISELYYKRCYNLRGMSCNHKVCFNLQRTFTIINHTSRSINVVNISYFNPIIFQILKLCTAGSWELPRHFAWMFISKETIVLLTFSYGVQDFAWVSVCESATCTERPAIIRYASIYSIPLQS